MKTFFAIGFLVLATLSIRLGGMRAEFGFRSDRTSSVVHFDHVVLPVGKNPGPIAIADVNRDGNADILVGNTGEGSITVLLGEGHGRFHTASGSPFPCNANPSDIAIADMNGDGNPDLVIANTQTPYLTILLGDGQGHFRPSAHSPFATSSHPHPHGVVVGDFIGDGKPAVVTDSWGNDQILLLPGDGKGNLILPGKSFAADLHTDAGVAAADFNHDGHPDIVTTSQKGNSVGLLLGDGHGGFRKASGSPFPAANQSWKFAIGDVNRDGNPDVIVIPYERDLTDPKQLGVTVLLGDGKGGFTVMHGSPFSLAGCHGPNYVATGDVNGDGHPDIVVSCAQSNNLFFFVGSGGGEFQRSSYDLPDIGWSGMAVADLNGDKKDDVVVSNFEAGTVTVLMGK